MVLEFAAALTMGSTPEVLRSRARERGYDELKIPMLVIEEYVKIVRSLFEESIVKLETAIEVQCNLNINQNFITRIERRKLELEREAGNAMAIQFGAPLQPGRNIFEQLGNGAEHDIQENMDELDIHGGLLDMDN
jgi:hypothetical protein